MVRITLQLVGLGLFVAWFFLLRPTFLGGSASYIMVAGASMEPSFYSGDLVITRKQAEYRVGDVAAYRTPNGNIIHRITEQRDDGRFVLLGDNKDLPDPAFPSTDEIVGKQWMLIPNGGEALNFMRQPIPFAVVLGGMALMTFSKRRQLSQFLQRRSRLHKRRSPITTGSLLPREPSQAMTVFATSLAITLVFLLTSVYALRQPATSANDDARPSYSHAVNFGYDIAVQPSTLYPDDTISSDEMAADLSSSQPVYAQLARDIDLDIGYQLQSLSAGDLIGEIGVILEVGAAGGWTKAMELQPATPFAGTTAAAHVSISIPEIQRLTTQIEEETGFKPGTYTVSVVPTISVRGVVENVPVDTAYSPTYTFELSATQITPKSELVQTRSEPIGSAPIENNQVSLAGLNIGVQPLRVLGGTATMIGMLITAAIAATVFLGMGRGEADKIQARFKTVFIEASGMNMPQPATVIDVASLQDLARLAERDGRIVFHQNIDAATHRYFVPDGTTMYQYVPRRIGNGG